MTRSKRWPRRSEPRQQERRQPEASQQFVDVTTAVVVGPSVDCRDGRISDCLLVLTIFTAGKKNKLLVQRRRRRTMDSTSGPQNLNPTIYERAGERATEESDYNNELRDEIDRREIFDLIRSISDPEHPLTLEGLQTDVFLPVVRT